jgi:hypothetical protein
MFADVILNWRVWHLECAGKRVAMKYGAIARKTSNTSDEAAIVFEGQMKIAEFA